MALHVPKAPGVGQMLKDGARLYSGLEESVFRNISACQEFAKTLRSAYGPCGMNKLVINHIKKQFLTSDAATIMRELEVEHPAVKLMIMSSKMQDAEIGDGTNFVVILAAALLGAAEELLRLGLIANDVIEGYELALQKCIEIMPSLCCSKVDDVLNKDQIRHAIRASIMSKQLGNEDFLADLVANACISVAKSNAAEPDSKTIVSFNVDNIRVVKIVGSGLRSSEIVQGMVFRSEAESYVKNVDNARIAVFNCPVDITQTESKGNVLIKSADELMSFNRGEEDLLERQIAALAEAGVNVVVAGAKFGDIALHYMNKYKLMAVRLSSKFELRRLSKTVKATVFARICVPTKEELGFCTRVYSDEIGETKVIVFKQNENESKIATIVVRGSTENAMDDVERSIDDGVNAYKVLTRDSRLLAGAGAFEIEMCTKLKKFAETLSDLQQYAVEKFAMVFEQFPKIIAENCGRNGNEVLNELYRLHNEKKTHAGVNVDLDSAVLTCDPKEQNYYDLYLGKMWAIRYAVIAAVTVLRIDQMIMAKKAGGPQARNAAQSDDEC